MPMLGGLRASTCSFSLCWSRPQLALIWQFYLVFSSKFHINSSEKAKQDRLGNGTRAGLAVEGSGPAPCHLCNIRFALLLLLHFFLYFSHSVLISQELKKPVRNENENRIWLSSIVSLMEFVRSLQKTPEQGKSWIKKKFCCAACFFQLLWTQRSSQKGLKT